MKRQPVVSSNLAEVGYDEETATLEILFSEGSLYQYFDVPRRVYESLLNAPSVGSYFHSEVRGVYRFARL